jgi:HEPN domain-containing protein
MCHLAIEKALKGIIQGKAGGTPPRTHNLVALAADAVPDLGDERMIFIARISQASIPTRYPERLAELQSIFDRASVETILQTSKETIRWLKSQT